MGAKRAGRRINEGRVRTALMVLSGVLIVLVAFRAPGVPRVRADTDDEFIATAVQRADLGSQAGDDAAATAALEKKFADCLRQKLAMGTARLDALGPCYFAVVAPDTGDELLGGLLDTEQQDALNQRIQDAQAKAAELLSSLQSRGATQAQIDALRPGLTACMVGWAVISEDLNQVAGWCQADLDDFDKLEKAFPDTPDPQAPTVGDLGCPDDITVNQPFTCNPVVNAPAGGAITQMAWFLDNGGTTVVTTQSAMLTLTDSDGHVFGFLACNGPSHCGGNKITIQGALPPPTGGTPGCPATSDAGKDVTCTASGWSPIDNETRYMWSVSAGTPNGGNLDPSYTFTYPNDGTMSVTVTLQVCNGSILLASRPKHCTQAPPSAVSLTGAAGAPQGSISCTSASGPLPVSVTCTQNLTNTDANTTYTWSNPGAAGQAGDNNQQVLLLDKPGTTYTITLTACNGSACFSPSASVTTDAAAPNGSISCFPQSGTAPLTVNCSANLTGTMIGTTAYGWSSTNSTGGTANDPNYGTTFNQAGTQTVSLQVCNGSACNTLTTSVTVNAPPMPPTASIGCSGTVSTGDPVSCTAQITGTVTSATWSAPNGNPASGTGTTFGTSYDSTGAQTITLTACNGSACTTATASVNVLRKAAPPTPAPAQQRQPITVAGSITETEGDIGCGFSAMPAGSGTITMTITFGTNPGDPAVVNGSFSGSSSGSRQVGCGGGTASETYQASFNASFTGVLNPQSGAFTASSTMRVNQSSHFSNCSGPGGDPVPCPSGATPTSYPVTISGTLTISGQSASGGGSLTMQSGCSTAGTWRTN